jgi:hypothetical protein
MCIHPEALSWVKNFTSRYANNYHSVDSTDPNLPSHAQWMVRQTRHPSNQREKFTLKKETEVISKGG